MKAACAGGMAARAWAVAVMATGLTDDSHCDSGGAAGLGLLSTQLW